MADTSIREATRRNCIKYQIEAEAMHRSASDCLIIGEIGEAITFQHLAKECAEEARMRLERLIGVA